MSIPYQFVTSFSLYSKDKLNCSSSFVRVREVDASYDEDNTDEMDLIEIHSAREK